MSTEKMMERASTEVNENLELAVQVMLEARAKEGELEAQYDDARKTRAIAEQGVIDKMLEQGVDSLKCLGKSISRTEYVRPSVTKDHRPEQIEWLRENGFGALVEETVNAQSFGALVRNDFVKQGKPVPEFINIYREQRLTVRSA